jgi:hypothetical protein
MILLLNAALAATLLTAPQSAPQTCEGSKPQATVPAEDSDTTDLAETMAAVDALEWAGGAAPNAEAQAALDAITNLIGSRSDPGSRAAAAMMRKYAGSPGGHTPAPVPTPRGCRR